MEWIEQILRVIAAGIGIWCFTITLNAPRKECTFCAINGAYSWLMYQLFSSMGAGAAISAMGAAFSVTIIARVFSAIRKHPVTVYLITAILPLVPGAAIYYTAYYLIMNDYSMAGLKCLEAFEIAGGITLGILFGFGFPQSIFNGIGRLSKRVEDARYQDRKNLKEGGK